MPYNLPVTLLAGASRTGITWVPSLLDSTGAPLAGLTTISNYEVGGGAYFFYHGIPNGTVGGIKEYASIGYA